MQKKKNNNKKVVRNQGIVWLAFVLAGLLPATGSAQTWDYGVNVDLGVIQTDNILLASSALKESETVYTVVPEFYLATDGERIEADLRYRPEAYFYSEFSDFDDVFHVLDASLTGTLIRDRLFAYLSATNYQSIITPDGQIPGGNIPISGNRVDSRTLEARPYWQQRIGQANILVEASFLDVEYDGDEFQSSNERSARLELDNIERQQGLAWGVGYQHRRVEYEVSAPWDFQRASLNLGFWINGSMRLFSEGGAETSIDNIFDSNMDADFWEAGFQYKPNQRLNLEVAAGDRFYGTSFRGDFSYTLRRGNVSLTYDEGPATRSDQAFDYRPINDTDDLDNILDRPGGSDQFLRRRGDFNASISLSKSELTFRVFAERRESRMAADGTPLEDEELTGAAIRWSWNLGTKTTLGIGADKGERDQEGRRDEFSRGQIDIAYNFTQRTSIRLEGLHVMQDGKDSNEYDYDENQVRLFFRVEL